MRLKEALLGCDGSDEAEDESGPDGDWPERDCFDNEDAANDEPISSEQHARASRRWNSAPPERNVVLEALRRRQPWAVRRLQEAARAAQKTYAKVVARAVVVGVDETSLTAAEAEVVDVIVDVVVDMWIAERGDPTSRE